MKCILIYILRTLSATLRLGSLALVGVSYLRRSIVIVPAVA
jgi:hypothetical protein